MIGPDDRPAPPNIVLVTTSLQGGGAERVMSDMASYWAGKGWTVTVATWSDPETRDFYQLPAEVRRAWLAGGDRRQDLASRVTASVRRILEFRRLLRTIRPDAILSFIDVSNVQTVLATRGLGSTVVISERHNPDQIECTGAYAGSYGLSRPWRLLRKLVYRFADRVTALNFDAAEWLKRECSVEVHVVPNPLRRLPDLALEREPLILAVGRLAKLKGFDLLLRAFARISAEFRAWHVLVIGAGPEHAALERLRDELGLQDRVEFMGPVSDVEMWMARAGLVVLPSRSEAYGNAALESLAMGAPLIATRCSGPSSFIENGVNGRLVPVEDVDALAKAMGELMADPLLRRQLGQEAKRVRETHHQASIMQRWEDLLLPRYQAQ